MAIGPHPTTKTGSNALATAAGMPSVIQVPYVQQGAIQLEGLAETAHIGGAGWA